ncbi:MAG: hypothetical protein HKN88_07495, partial [Gammaproteobacteria bacterium]|nr:hypothetical protein [Gammaproteobacteria bacterium]
MLNAAYKDTLYVVSDEMRATLKDIKAALELAIETRDNKHLGMVRELLHTAKGALELIDFNATAMLASEMNKVVDQLLERKSTNRDAALEAVSAGVVFLPSFFNKTLDSDGKEHSIALLPILQDLRAARQEKPLSEDTLLLLDIKREELSDKTIMLPKLKPQHDLRMLLGKYRSIFQTSLLGWIKDKESIKHLTRLAVISEKYEKSAKEERSFKLWWVTGGLIEALIEKGLKSSPDLRRLFGQVDRAGKMILDNGEEYFQANTDRTLINQLLYFIGRSESSGKRVTEIRKAFSLNDKLQVEDRIVEARAAMATPDSEVMQSLSKAIKEDLERVKDTLDIFNRTGSKENLNIEDRFQSLKKIADTLKMLGLDDLEKRVIVQQQEISALLERNENLTENHMIGVAASLLQVESRLEEELDKLAGKKAKDNPKFLLDALSATFRETKVNLARVKEVISQFMRDPTDLKAISRAPVLLKEANAACMISGKERLAVILERLQDYISRYLIGSGRLPYGEHLELLAGAIESVDFYLETLNKGRRDPWYMLDNADNCLDQLLREAPRPFPQTRLDKHSDYERTITEPAPSAQENNIGTGTVAVPRLTPADIERMQNPQHTEQTVHPDAYPVMDSELQTDPEVIEIFIEEAKEVGQQVAPEFASWLGDNSQREALVSVRRGFHTLKGSGRMVGAKRLGEFAWAVENLINRTLEGTVQIDNDGRYLLQRAIEVVPGLIEQLEVGTETKEDVHQLMLSIDSYTDQKLHSQDKTDATLLPGQMAKLQELTDTQTFRKSENEGTPASNAGELSSDAPNTQIIDMRNMLKEGFNPNADTPHTQIMDMRNVLSGKDTAEIEALVGADRPDIQIDDTKQSPQRYALEQALYDIYIDESSKHLSVVKEFCRDSIGKPVSNSMHRAVHTLHGSANMADLEPINEIATELERFIQRLYDEGLAFEEDAAKTVTQSANVIEEMIATINTDQAMPFASQALLGELENLRKNVDLLIEKKDDDSQAEDLDLDILDDVIHDDSLAYSETSRFSDSDDVMELNADIDLDVTDNTDDQADVGDAPAQAETGSSDALEATQETEQLLDELEVELDDILIVADSTQEPALQANAPTLIAVESEITNIFLEEAEELIAQSDTALSAWGDQGIDNNSISELQRLLHTLKGGARMAGLLSIGDFTHDLETFVIALRDNDLANNESARKGLQSALDHVHSMLSDVQEEQPPRPPAGILEKLQALIEGKEVESTAWDVSTEVPESVTQDSGSDLVVSDAQDTGEVMAFSEESLQDGMQSQDSSEFELPADEEPEQPEVQELNLPVFDDTYAEEPMTNVVDLHEAGVDADDSEQEIRQDQDYESGDSIFEYAPQIVPTQQRQQDAARISTNNLETLLNQAGEISIFRSRIEQELSNANLNLAELARTVQRVREQIRKMEIETEATILYQHREESEHS